MSANKHPTVSPNVSVYTVIQAANAKNLLGNTASATAPLQAPATSKPGLSGSTSDAPTTGTANKSGAAATTAGTANKSGATANKPVFKSKKRQVKHLGLQPLQILAFHACHQQS